MCENGHLDTMCFEVGKFIGNRPPTRRREKCLFIATKIVSMATKVFKQIHHRNFKKLLGTFSSKQLREASFPPLEQAEELSRTFLGGAQEDTQQRACPSPSSCLWGTSQSFLKVLPPAQP